MIFDAPIGGHGRPPQSEKEMGFKRVLRMC